MNNYSVAKRLICKLILRKEIELKWTILTEVASASSGTRLFSRTFSSFVNNLRGPTHSATENQILNPKLSREYKKRPTITTTILTFSYWKKREKTSNFHRYSRIYEFTSRFQHIMHQIIWKHNAKGINTKLSAPRHKNHSIYFQ